MQLVNICVFKVRLCFLTNTKGGDLVYYDAIQHHYKECLEHGNTLEEAIELMEKMNGS